MEYFPSHAGGDRAAFAGKTLVIPAVGHGNVGQLAVDLMIQTLVVDRLGSSGASGASRLGCLDHPSLLPCVGTDAFAPIGGRGGVPSVPGTTNALQIDRSNACLATALELHGDERILPGVVILQQRGDVATGASSRFALDLASFIESCAFNKVVIVASLPSTAQNASNETVGDTRFRHLRVVKVPPASNGESKSPATFAFAAEDDDRWTKLGAPKIEPDSIPIDAPDRYSLPPWSLLRALAQVSSKTGAAIDASCLVAVCSEGDNSDDAARAAETTSRFLEIQISKPLDADEESLSRSRLRETWSVPSSWLGAYGRRAAARAMFA